MAARSIRVRLIDIRDKIAGIRDLTKGATASSFAASWAMKRAVQHAMLIIAEAAKHIPSELKENSRIYRGTRYTASETCSATNIAGSIRTSSGP